MSVHVVAAEPPPASRREQAASLGATRRGLFFLGAVVGIAAPIALWGSGISDGIWHALSDVTPWLGVPMYVALVSALLIAASIPVAFYGDYVIGHRYGLSRQTVRGWLADLAKSSSLGIILTTAAASVFYATVWAAPTSWWLLFWLEAMAAVITLTFVAPYVIVPIFFKLQPIDDPGLVMMIDDLARRAGASVAGVSRLDFSRRTNEANAAVIGFGRSRRVILADTLLESFTLSEIRAVVAHELGHHVNRDVARLLLVQAVMMVVGLGLAALAGDRLLGAVGAEPMAAPSSYPLVVAAATVAGLIGLPFANGFSRRVEAQADTFAFRLLGDGAPFASAMLRLADQNLGEIWPPRWAELLLASHPAIGRRVERARSVQHG